MDAANWDKNDDWRRDECRSRLATIAKASRPYWLGQPRPLRSHFAKSPGSTASCGVAIIPAMRIRFPVLAQWVDKQSPGASRRRGGRGRARQCRKDLRHHSVSLIKPGLIIGTGDEGIRKGSVAY